MKSLKGSKTKTCTKCKKELPYTTEYFFHARQKNKDGTYRHSLRGKCKRCYIGPLKEKVIKTHKTCTNCHIEFPNTTEHFRLKTDTKGCKYLFAWCRKCETVRNAEWSLIRDHKRRAKELELSLDEYSKNSRKYMGWTAYKRKNPTHKHDDYLTFKSTSVQRRDVVRKSQRDNLTDRYIKNLIAKRSPISVFDLDNCSDVVDIQRKSIKLQRHLKLNKNANSNIT